MKYVRCMAHLSASLILLCAISTHAENPTDFQALCAYGEQCEVKQPTLVAFGSLDKMVLRSLSGPFVCHGKAFGKRRADTGQELCYVHKAAERRAGTSRSSTSVKAEPKKGTVLPAGDYAIISHSSGKALEVRNASAGDGAQITQSDFQDAPHQIWRITPINKSHYSIVALHSKKALQAQQTVANDGAKLQQYPWLDSNHQHWSIEPVTDDLWRITSRANGKAVDVYEMNKNNQGAVVTWSFWGGENQLWSFVPVDGSDWDAH